mgnify:FL=1
MVDVSGREWNAHDLAAWQAGRARARAPWEWTDWFVLAFALLMLGSMAASVIGSFHIPLIDCGEAWSATCVPARLGLPIFWTAASGVVVALLAVLAGPLAVGPAASTWLLSLPVDRGQLLAAPFRRLTVAGACFGLVAGVLLWALAGVSWWWVAASVVAATSAITATVLSQQGVPPLSWTVLLVATCLLYLALSSVALLGTLPSEIAGCVTALLLLAFSAYTGWLAHRGLGRLNRYALAERGRWSEGITGASQGADGGLVLDIVAPRLAGRRRRSIRGERGTGGWAVVRYECARIARRSPALLIAMPLVWTLAFVGMLIHPSTLAIATIAGVPALGLVLSSLRVVGRAPGLARTLPLSRRALRLALTSGAFAVTLLWISSLTLATWAAGVPVVQALPFAAACGVASLAGAIRWVGAGSPNFETGYVMTDAGPVPLGALATAVRGFDVAALVGALIAVGLPAPACVLVAVGSLSFVLLTT